MDPAAHLIARLADFSHEPGADDARLRDLAEDLMTALDAAVPSLVGVRIVLDQDDDRTVVVTAAWGTAPSALPRTSLRLTLRSPGRNGAALTVYAERAGALVDLAADLGYLGDRQDALSRLRPDVRLDADLSPAALVPGVTGLQEGSLLDRAIGVLIDRGEDPDNASDVLRRRASAAGLDVLTYAASLTTRRTSR